MSCGAGGTLIRSPPRAVGGGAISRPLSCPCHVVVALPLPLVSPRGTARGRVRPRSSRCCSPVLIACSLRLLILSVIHWRDRALFIFISNSFLLFFSDKTARVAVFQLLRELRSRLGGRCVHLLVFMFDKWQVHLCFMKMYIVVFT